MGLRLLWQPAIAVIVTHDDCVVVFWQINSLSLSQRNTQVRPWTVTASTRRPALALCGRSCPFQARDDSPPVSEQQGAALPGWQLHPSLQSRGSSAAAISPTSPS